MKNFKNQLKLFFRTAILLIFTTLLSISVNANLTKQINQKYFNKTQNLFYSDTLITIVIYTDLRDLIRDVGDNRKYHKGTLSYNSDSVINIPVQLRARGNFRRRRDICNFPPIQIKFDTTKVKNTLFNKQKRLKLVTHCKSYAKYYEQHVIQEYLIYKAYNLFTPESLRVRLAHITYQDIKNKLKPVTKYAFFIEDVNDMASRNNKVQITKKNIHQDATSYEKMTLLSVFQYMIGNTDWSVTALHNIKLIASKKESKIIAVPYDFDWSSLVNAPYAVPNEKLPIKSIHERLYRGYQRTPEELEHVLKKFRTLKKNLYDIYVKCPYLNDKEKKRVLKYFDEFYEIINNPKKIKRELIDGARKYKFKRIK